MMCVNVFYITRKDISVGSDEKREVYPLTPIIKIAQFCNVMSIFIDMPLQNWATFIVGCPCKILCISSDQAEMLFLVIKKNIDTHHESFS